MDTTPGGRTRMMMNKTLSVNLNNIVTVCEPNCLFKGALYRIWCGVNRLSGSGVKVV